MPSQEISKIDIAFAALFIMAGLVLGSAVLLFQAYTYLRYGMWPPISLIDGLSLVNFGWATNPTDWKGLHKILSKIPLSLVFFIAGFLPAIALKNET